MKIKRDQITGLLLVAIGIFFAILTSRFSVPMTLAYPGPKMLPSIAEFGLIVCGAGIFVKGCLQKEADKPFVGKQGWINILVTFLILCVYVFLMKFFSFWIVTPFVTFALVTYFTRQSPFTTKLWVRIVYALAVTAVIYVMYVVLFGMNLPTGSIF